MRVNKSSSLVRLIFLQFVLSAVTGCVPSKTPVRLDGPELDPKSRPAALEGPAYLEPIHELTEKAHGDPAFASLLEKSLTKARETAKTDLDPGLWIFERRGRLVE